MTGMARRRVGSTLALAAALATVLFSVRARADTMVHLSGDATPGGPEHFWVPFDVPAGTKEIQIAHDDHSPDDILDWGVYDEKGAFRGYGGGNVEDAVIGELASSRSYLVGPIAAGTWKVDVGKAKIASAKVSWTIDVTFRSAPTLAPQPLRAPYAPQPALKKEARWYQGDFHAHSIESGDAKPPIPDMIAFAKTRGLDFIELSDHNTTSQLDFYQQYRDGQVLLIPGVEYTTYAGHANGIGATKWVDHKIGTDGATILGGVQSIHAQGALFSINHPVLELGDLCIGCAWKHDVPPEQIDAVEIETGGWRQVGVLFGQRAVQFWDDLCAKGRHVAAIGGSDDHSGGKPMSFRDSAIGSPTTVVFAEELSAQGVIDGIKKGRTVVKLQDPTDPMIELDAEGRDADSIAAKRTVLHAKVTGGKGSLFHFVIGGAPEKDVPIDADPWTVDRAIDAPAAGETRVRAEVWSDTAPRTITSHLWLRTGAASYGGSSGAKVEGGCACDTSRSSGASPTWAAAGALAGLAAMLARRARRVRRG